MRTDPMQAFARTLAERARRQHIAATDLPAFIGQETTALAPDQSAALLTLVRAELGRPDGSGDLPAVRESDTGAYPTGTELALVSAAMRDLYTTDWHALASAAIVALDTHREHVRRQAAAAVPHPAPTLREPHTYPYEDEGVSRPTVDPAGIRVSIDTGDGFAFTILTREQALALAGDLLAAAMRGVNP